MSPTMRDETQRPVRWRGGAGRLLALPTLFLAFALILTACGGGTSTATTGAASSSAPASGAPSTGASTAPSTSAAPAPSAAPSTSAAPTSGTGASSAPATRTTGTTATAPTTAGTATRPGSAATAGAAATPNSSIKITGPYPGEAKTLNGAGSTFVQVLFSKWFDDYSKMTNVNINYQGNGSGAGKKAITDQTVNFAASDAFMTDQELKDAQAKCGDTILHFPIALGAVVVTYNVPGLENTKLKMDGDLIAGIFSGAITKWSDQKIKDQNPGVNLPNNDIVVVHRSDGSGTTDIFTSYLTAVSSSWASGPKSGTTVNWPTGIGASGNAGVAGELKNNPNSIGYVELAYANQQKLPVADLKNKAGQYTAPSNAGVTAAAEQFAPTAPADLRLKIVNADGAASYPISGMTWVLVCPKQTDQAKAVALTRMLWWGLHDGQSQNEGLDYAKVPNSFVVREEQFINQITVNGQKAFPGK
jgi:phosphate transport system substrate-binding protein